MELLITVLVIIGIIVALPYAIGAMIWLCVILGTAALGLVLVIKNLFKR